MTLQLERDLGRVEAKVEIMSDDIKVIKSDLNDIKLALGAQKAVKINDHKRLLVVGTLAAVLSHIVAWIKPFILGA